MNEEYKGYKIKIVQDDHPESPDDWGREDCFLVYDHRQFTIKREGFAPEEIQDYLNDPKSDEVWSFEDYYIFPVEAYIHSGVALTLGGNKTCSFDSSVSGYILVNKSDFSEDDVYGAAENLIVHWNQYLCGDVYGYIIEKKDIYYTIHKSDLDEMINTGTFTSKKYLNIADIEESWYEVESCYGFYGDSDGYILHEARSIVDNLLKTENNE